MNKDIQTSRPRVRSYVITGLLTVWIGYFALGFGLVVPQYARLFAAFGADLPGLTQFVLSTRMPIWGFLLVGFLVQVGLFVFLLVARTFAVRRMVYSCSAVNVAVQLVLIGAMYAPIIKMGAVV